MQHAARQFRAHRQRRYLLALGYWEKWGMPEGITVEVGPPATPA